MTDNEIIKALGRCPYQRDCVSCDIDSCDNSPNYIMKNARDLINRQKAENEKLQDLIVKTNAEIAKQEAEIERLQNDRNTILKAQHEWADSLIRTALATFAEKLKIKAKTGKGYLGNVYCSVAVNDIDETYREMVGESNAE